ncbi:MAG: MFS transporter [Alphaproteobacteria bacterium]|nr:MFS transporter [Alphaproteobacteria bacterium]
MTARWSEALAGYLKPRVSVFLLLGFVCGLPYNLLGYSLSLWMRNVGVSLAVIGFFSLVFIPYSLKFLWAPVVDRVRIPYLARHLGQKKSWALVFQAGLIASIWGLACHSPDQNTIVMTRLIQEAGRDVLSHIPVQTFVFAFLTAFFAASQDIVVDALRIDTLNKEELGEGAGTYQLGYRMGLLVSGAGVVWASSMVSWNLAYAVVGLAGVLGMIGILCVREEPRPAAPGPLLRQMVVSPFADFMTRKLWLMILVFIALYKVSNAVLGRMALPFYYDIGFTKAQIALVSGLYGPFITLLGVLAGGVLAARYSVLKCLFWLGFVEIGTSLVFAGLAAVGPSMPVFALTILFDNIVGGIGGAVFIAYLSGLCSKAYSATQYALLTSMMAVAVSVIASYSGVWAGQMGYPLFFVFTGLLMAPALILLRVMMRKTA